MLVLGILGALLAVILAVSVASARRFSFPEAYAPRPVPLEGLPPDDAARLEDWGRALDARGFAKIGDFRVDLPLGPPGGIVQVEQKRVWLSGDRTTWAAAKRFSVLNPALDGSARSWRMLGFSSALPSGGIVSTHTCPAADPSVLRDPESSSRVWPGLEDVDLLLAAHRRHLEERGAEPAASDGDLQAFERAAWRRTSEFAQARGYLVLRDGRLRSTWKLAFLSSLRGLNPLLLERGGRAAVAGRLGAAAGAASLAAFLLGEAPAWAVAALFAASALACCFLFPQSHLISWTLAMLPAHLVLHARGAPSGWGWIAGAATAALVLPALEGGRFRRAAAALARPDAGPPPLSRRARGAWAAAIAACFLAGAALLVWMRSPKQPGCSALLLICAVALSTTGILVASVAAGLVRSLKRSALKRTLDGLAAGAVLLLGGTAGGGLLGMQDAAASRAAAEEVSARLEARRAATGTYPATLAELGPLPAPRCGWGPAAFAYLGPPAFGRPDGYALTWPTYLGPRSRVSVTP